MRIDWFVPFLRKPKKNETLRPLPPVVRAAQWFLPESFFADRERGKPGLLRRTLRWFGPTVLSSPARRAIQGFCFVAFLWLFFYVCWPYTAEPLPPGKASEHWKLAGIDQQRGRFRFAQGEREKWLASAKSIHIVDGGAAEYEDDDAGQFDVLESTGGELLVRPSAGSPPESLDLLLTRDGPWSIHRRAPDAWPRHYADDLAAKETLPAETFLAIDPLVSLSTAIASRHWVWSLVSAGVILLVCIVIPRGFCGYLCPLGTLIDLFDWSVSKRVTRFRVTGDGWWVHLKYYLLTATIVAAFCGVLVSGFVAAIPVITRGFLFLFEPLQSGAMRGWHLVPELNADHFLSIALFVIVLGLGLLQPRFWCKYVCPSGAVFSLGNLFRLTERKVEESCIHCNKCVEICPFDAIKPDFTTRVTDCTLCQTCGGVCPTHAIKFVDRWNLVDLKVENSPPTNETQIGRRGFMSLAAGTAGAVIGAAGFFAATRVFGRDESLPVRPPGSVPEREFLDMCIRCGECFKACPNNVLQSVGFEHGLESLWTPKVVADWAGCESSCNACGQVCPTGAIRALPIEEKKAARMGLAIVNTQTCLPFAGREECDLCVVECRKAGYDAIEQRREGTEVDVDGNPVPDSGFIVPVVLPDKCVGCGLCQTRCYSINVKSKELLHESAIVIEAGGGREDRMMTGSYRQLRHEEQAQREIRSPRIPKDPLGESDSDNGSGDPFGLSPALGTSDEDPF